MTSSLCRVCHAPLGDTVLSCPSCGTAHDATTDHGTCPAPAVLARRLAEALADAEASLVDAHVEHCAACQKVLDGLVAGPDGEKTGPPSAGFLDDLKRTPLVTSPEALPRAGEGAAVSVPGHEIVKELGRGGMGVVYLARQTRLGRLVALKMILAGGHAGEAELARFRTEGEAIARLSHPNIVQVHEVGDHDGKPYFSLEYCPGGSLADRLAAGPPDVEQAARWVETLARAMQAAHAANVIHRDLKPANVLLGADGSPKITDFGLAKKLDDAGQTHTGAIMGTPSYMAPEQAEGKKDIGPLADVYALGAILYACLTGRPPFQAASSFDTIMQVVADDPIPPSRLRAAVPRDLETVCLKCLHKDPAKRYASALDLADDLRRFLDGEPIRARPVGPVERAWRWCRRNRAVASSLAALFLVLLAGVVVSSSLAAVARAEKGRADEKADLAEKNEKKANKNADDARVSAENEKKAAALAKANEENKIRAAALAKRSEEKAHQEKTRADAARRDAVAAQLQAEERTVALHVAAGLRLVDEGDLLGALPWLAEALRRERDPARAMRHRMRIASVLRRCPRLVGMWTENVYEATPSPDGRHIAARSLRDGFTELAMIDASTGKGLYPPVRLPMRAAVKFNLEGSQFVTIEDHLPARVTIQLRDTLTGKPAGKPIASPSLEVNTSFSPDGRRLLTIHITEHTTRNLRLWDLATGADVTPEEFRGHRPQMFMRAMDGDAMVSLWDATDPATLKARAWSLSKGEAVGAVIRPERDPGERQERFSGACAPDGSRFMIGLGRVGTLFDMTPGGPVRLPSTLRTAEEIGHAHMFLGGTRLATVTAGGTQWWDARTGKLLRTWRRGREGDQEVEFSDDGRLVLFHDKATDSGGERVRVWDWQADEPASPLMRHAAALDSRHFLPDARRLLTIHRSPGDLTRGEMLLWDLHPAPPRAMEFKCWTDRIGRSCISPDGSRVVCEAPEGFVVRSTVDGKPVAPVIVGHPVGASFSDSGRHLLVTFEKPKRVRTYDLDGKLAGEPIPIGLEKSGVLDMLADAAVSPDGKQAVLVRIAGREPDDILKYRSHPSVELWDAVNGVMVKRLITPPFWNTKAVMVKNVGFAPDGRRVVAVMGEATRDETPGGGGLKLPGRFFVRVWDERGAEMPAPPLAGGMHQQNFHIFLLGQMARSQRFLAFSPDGKRLAVSFGGARGLLAGRGAKDPTAELQHEGLVGLVTFSGDGKLVLTASDDQTARLWDADTGSPAGPPLNHGVPVKAAAFGPAGLVATAGGDGTVRVWDAATASPLTPLFRPPGAKRAGEEQEAVQVGFSGDGRRLMLTASGRIWWHDLSPDMRPPEVLTRVAELLAGRRIEGTGASLTPLNAAALRERWEALIARGEGEAGVGRLRREDMLAWHRGEGRLAEAGGEWTAAAHHWGHLTRAEPGDVEAWKGRGRAHLELGLPARAAADLWRATRAGRKDAEAWHLSGRALAAMGLHADAAADYSRAIEMGRKMEALEDRADSYAEQEMWTEAAMDLADLTRDAFKDPRGGVGGTPSRVYKTGLVFAFIAAIAPPGTPGIEKGHHAACAWFAHRFWRETTPARARHLAYMCALAQGEKAFLPAMVAYPKAVGMPLEGAKNMYQAVHEGVQNFTFDKRGEVKLEGEVGIGGGAYCPLTAGAFMGLRLGHHKSVVDILTLNPPRIRAQALKIAGKGDLSSLSEASRRSLGLDGTPWNDLLMAIAQAKLGRKEEARKAYDSAVKRIEGGKWAWPERLELKLLRLEAEAALGEK